MPEKQTIERAKQSAAENPPALKPSNLSERKYIISGKINTGRDRPSRLSRLAVESAPHRRRFTAAKERQDVGKNPPQRSTIVRTGTRGQAAFGSPVACAPTGSQTRATTRGFKESACQAGAGSSAAAEAGHSIIIAFSRRFC